MKYIFSRLSVSSVIDLLVLETNSVNKTVVNLGEKAESIPKYH